MPSIRNGTTRSPLDHTSPKYDAVIFRGLLTINGIAILAACFALYILYQSITQRVIAIAPISVPKELADYGYTPMSPPNG
jgi:hypothetical protein